MTKSKYRVSFESARNRKKTIYGNSLIYEEKGVRLKESEFSHFIPYTRLIKVKTWE